MKRTASDDEDGGAKKAPRLSPGPSRQGPSYSIETDPSEDSPEDSYDTDPSEDPSTTPPESPNPGAEDPVEDGYDTDISEDLAMTPPELLTSEEEDSHEAGPSEHSSGMTQEEIFKYAPALIIRENLDSPATSESAMDFSCSWPGSPVGQDLFDRPYPSDSDAGDNGNRVGREQTGVDDSGHTSHGSSPGTDAPGDTPPA
ncbi:uncharacterized protein LOC132638447 [Lycium barbarum]|uniref:uncharacterized protein LOC132633940 n=1 Tax=Lycium barbarum TaxID=112863 RepID=UPI00293E35F2|nr:uncharacterized protein LOC132633940 [Lycium barbarum]XP_060211305.1 uncharacterized protein LOC132638447 [Lycium barbarum]